MHDLYEQIELSAKFCVLKVNREAHSSTITSLLGFYLR